MDLRLQSSDDGDLNTYSMMFGENDGSTTPHSLSDDGDLTHSMMAVNWGGASVIFHTKLSPIHWNVRFREKNDLFSV